MEKFGVHKDLASYKKLLNVFPKGRFIPENRLQVREPRLLEAMSFVRTFSVVLKLPNNFFPLFPQRNKFMEVLGRPQTNFSH